MNIEFELDRSEPLNLVDVYGSIKVIGLHNAEIVDEFTCLDYFIEALAKALIEVKSSDRSSIDFIVEPDPIVVTRDQDTICLSYGTMNLECSYESAINAVNRAYIDLLEQLPPVDGINRFIPLDRMMNRLMGCV